MVVKGLNALSSLENNRNRIDDKNVRISPHDSTEKIPLKSQEKR